MRAPEHSSGFSPHTACRDGAAEAAPWSLAAKIMILMQVREIVQRIRSDLTSAAVSPSQKGCLWWNPMLQPASVIY